LVDKNIGKKRSNNYRHLIEPKIEWNKKEEVTGNNIKNHFFCY